MSRRHEHDNALPAWVGCLLESFCAPHLLEEVQGDLLELYGKWVEKHGVRKARWLYAFHAIKFLRPYSIKKLSINNPTDMLKNYFKIAFRNLKHRRVYSLINVLGLGLSMACVILIFSLVRYHLSFDTYHSNEDRIYRITTEYHREGEISYMFGVPQPMGEALRHDYTFAEKVASVATLPDRIVSISAAEDKKFEEDIAFAEPTFFDILDFPLVQGNPQSVLRKPNTAIIAERVAKKYFGEEDPMGQTLHIDHQLDVVITGILRDLPANTDRRQEIYLPFSNLKDHTPWMVEEGWPSITPMMQCFVLLKPGVSPGTVNQALAALPKKYYNERDAKVFQFKLQPLSDIHFNPDLGGYIAKQNLWALSLIGLFLIVTACVNFINLATAQALGRSKEIGVRKVLGSIRRQIFWQFMTETALIVMLALGSAIMLAYLALPYVNQYFDLQISIPLFHDVGLIAFLSLLLLVAIFFSGAYPGVIMAGFQPVIALKGLLTQSHIGGFSLRRGLVITQFAISQLLIIGIIVIAHQMRYVQQHLGFEKEAIVMLPVPEHGKSTLNTLDTQLSQIAGVEKVSFCNEAPVRSQNYFYTGIRFDTRSEDENFSISFKAGDDQYISTFGLQIVEGRNLQPSDTIREFLLNETAVKKLGFTSYQDVIGKTADIYGIGTIVGVVKDFHNLSFRQAIDPLCITTASDRYGSCAVKIHPANLTSSLSKVEKIWNASFPAQIYHYDFLDEQVARFYQLDNILFHLIQLFAAITILIACLGLYGLVSFMVTQKTKEVGMRKVLGASVQRILWLFGKEFSQLLLLAFVIAAPLAWWITRLWLENFAYRIDIGAAVFVLAITATFLVAMITVGYQTLKAALANPVDSLRNE